MKASKKATASKATAKKSDSISFGRFGIVSGNVKRDIYVGEHLAGGKKWRATTPAEANVLLQVVNGKHEGNGTGILLGNFKAGNIKSIIAEQVNATKNKLSRACKFVVDGKVNPDISCGYIGRPKG